MVIPFVIFVAGNKGRIFAPGMSLIGYVRRVDISDGGRILASLRSIFVMLLLFLFLPSFLVRSVAVFGPQEIWGFV